MQESQGCKWHQGLPSPRRDTQKGARLVTELRMVAAQCNTWREMVREQRRHCSPAASRTFHIPGLLLHLQHPCIPTGSFQAPPQTEGVQIPGNIWGPFRFYQMRVWLWDSDKPWSDSPMKELGWKMYLEGEKPWTKTGPFLTFQNGSAQLPESQTAPLQTILQCQGGRPTMIFLTAVMGWFWTGPSFKREHRLGITCDSSSLGTIPTPHIVIPSHGGLLWPQSHRPISTGTIPNHGNNHKVMNKYISPERGDFITTRRKKGDYLD